MWYKKAIIAARKQNEIYRHSLDNIPLTDTLHEIFEILRDNGKRALVVGGAVRDALLGYKPKDIDVEVYNIDYPELQIVLSDYLQNQRKAAEQGIIQVPMTEDGRFKYNGHADFAGQQFGVVKFSDLFGNQYDFSIPRRENKTPGGLHTDFDIQPDPTMTPKDAASRRDFTFNALAYDPLTNEIHDYFGGVDDLNNKILRHTSSAFSDDPLRVLRGAQFASRMGLTIAPETAELSKQIADTFTTGVLSQENPEENPNMPHLARERIAEEFMKFATKGKFPSKLLDYLVATDWIRFFPELGELYGVPQDEEWHPEGDVDAHTRHVMDAAAEIADRDGLEDDDRAILMLSAMLHDVAKPSTTQQREKNGRTRWTSYGHEQAGGPISEKFLQSIGIKPDIIKPVKALIENHLGYISYGDNPSDKAINNLAKKLHMSKTNIDRLMQLIEADVSGRPPLPKQLDPKAINVHNKAKELGVNERPMEPFIQGRDIMEIAPEIQPGPIFGQIIEKFYALQTSGAIKTKEQALQKLKEYFDKKKQYRQ
jgi:tRNA nucleotidyltransferase (CCA-adding enzyme)